MTTKNILHCFIVLLLFSCKTQNLLVEKKVDARFQNINPDSNFFYTENYQYQIQKDDKISISFWGNDDLSVGSEYGIYNSNEVYGKWLLVDGNGEIMMPRIGNFKTEGLTVIQAKDTLIKIFKKWYVNPVIDIKVLNKEINILGEQKTPGKYIVDKDNNTILDIVSMAGGFEFYADLQKVKIVRQFGDKVKMINVDLTVGNYYFNRDLQLHPGDLVIVPSKKNKEFDKRISTIIPLVSSATGAALILKTFL